MTRSEVLDAARSAVCTDRNERYGEPEDSFGKIAAYWSTYLGITLTARQVGDMMILFKVGRLSGMGNNDDTYTDIAGYAACAGECGHDN